MIKAFSAKAWNDFQKIIKVIASFLTGTVDFTVVCLVSWPLGRSEVRIDFYVIQTSMLFICKCQVVDKSIKIKPTPTSR